jgi:Ca2+:H+ antiporter
MPKAQSARLIASSWLNLLLIAAPISWVLAWTTPESTLVFIMAAVSLVPAAGVIGTATEHLSAELIIAIAALRAGHTEVVKASITGSIIGNLLLVFGASCFVGGLRCGTQRFNRTAAGSATVMLFLAIVALVMPAVVDLVSFGSLKARPPQINALSLWASLVLLGVYVAGLVFAFRTHHDPLRVSAGHDHGPHVSARASMSLLAAATALTAVQAELLIGALQPALAGFGMTELFAGVILVALVGNAAEHFSAVTAALNDEMTLALEISIGSSAQIALMVGPVLVLLSHALGSPMSLVFNAFEITAIGLSVLGVALVVLDGESNWLEGLQLLGVYVILALAFYVIPG